jgi:hypothetical protein
MARQNDALANFSGTTNNVLTLTDADTAYALTTTDMAPAFCMVQNVGTSPVYVRLTSSSSGAGASTSNYTLVLAAGSTAADGQGGTLNLAGYTEELSFLSSTAGAKVNISYSGRQGD